MSGVYIVDVLTSVSVFSVLTMFKWGLWSRPGKTAALHLTFFYKMHTIAKDNKWPLSTPLPLLVICPIRGTIRWGAQIHLWPPYKIKPLWTLYFTLSLMRPFSTYCYKLTFPRIFFLTTQRIGLYSFYKNQKRNFLFHWFKWSVTILFTRKWRITSLAIPADIEKSPTHVLVNPAQKN